MLISSPFLAEETEVQRDWISYSKPHCLGAEGQDPKQIQSLLFNPLAMSLVLWEHEWGTLRGSDARLEADANHTEKCGGWCQRSETTTAPRAMPWWDRKRAKPLSRRQGSFQIYKERDKWFIYNLYYTDRTIVSNFKWLNNAVFLFLSLFSHPSYHRKPGELLSSSCWYDLQNR